MTLNQRALLQTTIFVVGTIGIGAVVSTLWTYWPEITSMTLLVGFFLFLIRLYYVTCRAQLQREADEIHRSLRG
jgi:hypothetical protein